MAPTRSKKVVGTVLKTTKNVVKEMVKVEVVLPMETNIKDNEKETEDSEENIVVKPEEKKKKKKRKRRGSNVGVASSGYKRYVFRVLKQVHPGMRVSAQAMNVLEGMMRDMFERIAEEAAQLNMHSGKVTLSSKEIQDAVRLIMPGELGKHAISEGVKAVTTYMEK